VINVRWIFQIIILFATAMIPVLGFAKESEKRNQLEEFYIWKLSDEMKLSPAEEKKFAELVKSLNEKKSQLNEKMQISIEKISKLTETKKRDNELVSYRKTLQEYNRISEEEFDKIKNLLGVDKTAQYLQIKQDLTKKIKSMLANPESSGKSEKKNLPAPKVIEEK
jgi:hypothetical protein